MGKKTFNAMGKYTLNITYVSGETTFACIYMTTSKSKQSVNYGKMDSSLLPARLRSERKPSKSTVRGEWESAVRHG